jgi:hypothetical protein
LETAGLGKAEPGTTKLPAFVESATTVRRNQKRHVAMGVLLGDAIRNQQRATAVNEGTPAATRRQSTLLVSGAFSSDNSPFKFPIVPDFLSSLGLVSRDDLK